MQIFRLLLKFIIQHAILSAEGNSTSLVAAAMKHVAFSERSFVWSLTVGYVITTIRIGLWAERKHIKELSRKGGSLFL